MGMSTLDIEAVKTQTVLSQSLALKTLKATLFIPDPRKLSQMCKQSRAHPGKPLGVSNCTVICNLIIVV